VLASLEQINDNNVLIKRHEMDAMESLIEFGQNNLLLTGLFVAVLVAWIVWEVARLGRKWQEIDTLAAVRFINQEDPLTVSYTHLRAHET